MLRNVFYVMDLQDIEIIKKNTNNMVITLTLTKDHLKLIPFFFVQEFDDEKVGVDKTQKALKFRAFCVRFKCGYSLRNCCAARTRNI